LLEALWPLSINILLFVENNWSRNSTWKGSWV
jgi:hypothetical protein